jgi:hypothetical protein
MSKLREIKKKTLEKVTGDDLESSVMRYERVYPAIRGPDREVDGLWLTLSREAGRVVIVLVDHGMVHRRRLLQSISTCLPP